MDFDYARIPRKYMRRYVPQSLAFSWEGLQKMYEELGARDVDSVDDLQRWLRDEAEVGAFEYEQRAIRSVNYTRQTDNKEYETEYTKFIEEIEPKIKLADFALLKKYVSSTHRQSLPKEVYSMTNRKRVNAVEIFREENVELEKADALLGQKYQKTFGEMTVNFRGEELTMQQIARYYEVTDRATRKEAWELAEQRALKDKEVIESIYDEMVKLRDQEGRNAGFANYRDYIFRKKNRFDYTPEDCLRFHDAVEKYMVPLSRSIDKKRREKMGLDVLMPWDMRVDPDGKPPLSPFENVDTLIAGCQKVIAQVDPALSSYFGTMVELGLLDLESRKGKAPGGYQEDFAELKVPFIFMNAAKRDNDVRVLLHESGHSFQTFLMRDAGLPFFNSGPNIPLEFAEVASTSMELLSSEHLKGTFYSPEEAKRSNIAEVTTMVKLFTWVATIDSFQHWVYTNPGHSRDQRIEAWSKTFRRFAGLEDYSGHEDSLRYRWHRQLHLFEVPFYYIEYGIATLGALGIWLRYRKNRGEAIAAYKTALSLGSSVPLPELFRTAGLPWDLGPTILERYSVELAQILKEYE